MDHFSEDSQHFSMLCGQSRVVSLLVSARFLFLSSYRLGGFPVRVRLNRRNNLSIMQASTISTLQVGLTGSIGMVLDSVREVDATRFQHLVQWSDDKSLSRDSWELQEDLSVIPETSNPELYFEIKD